MTHHDLTRRDGSYPTPAAEFRASLVPLLTALMLSAVLVSSLAIAGFGA